MKIDIQDAPRFYWSENEMQNDRGGDYVLFTDHERVVGELQWQGHTKVGQLANEIDSLRNALAESNQRIERVKAIVEATRKAVSAAYEVACHVGDERAQSLCNARFSLLNNITEALENNNG